MSPRSANPGSASTRSTPPRATARADCTTFSSSTLPTKQTSRPPARRIAPRMARAAAGASRVTVCLGRAGEAAGMAEYTEDDPNPPRLRLEWFLLRGRKEDVVQDQSVPGRIRVQRQIRRRAPDGVLRVLRVVTAVVRPGALAVVAVNVLDPRGALFEGEDRNA